VTLVNPMAIHGAEASTLSEPLRVGVIGCGYWGPNVVRNFCENPRTDLVAVADVREQRLRAIAPRCGGAFLTTSVEEVLVDPAVEAVAITTPVSTHYELAAAALAAGKHVLLAKPLTGCLADAQALLELARQAERILMVDHTFVYTGAVRKMRELVDAGTLGKLYYFDSVRINLGLLQHDVNVVWDLAAHDFSILAHLIDVEPVAIAAHGACHSGSGLADVAYVTIQYPDDFIAHFHLNWLSPVKVRQTLLGGARRMLVWDDIVADEKVKIYDRGVRFPDQGDESDYKARFEYRTGDAWIPQLDGREALATEIDHLVDCVRGGQSPITGVDAGCKVVQMLETALASLELGGAMVSIVDAGHRQPSSQAEPVAL
jgi:predicted dehydrogenase